MSVKATWVLVILSCMLVFAWSVYRDTLAEKQYTGDLRNRVVGARLQKDGLLPYFYKWKKGDGLRYYDPDNFDSLKAANITASPFFHHLLYPIAEWPQQTINACWLLAEYAAFIIIVLLGLSLTTTREQRWMLLCTASLFLLTEGWKMHIGNGQNYLFIPLLTMAFYCCIGNKASLLMAIVAGCCVATLVLIKPNALLFFIPFLLLLQKYRIIYLGVLLLPLLAAGIWIMTSSSEILLWKQYKENITQQAKAHQKEAPVLQVNEPDPHFRRWEGIDMSEINRQTVLHPLHIFSENGNVFVFVQLLFHKKLTTTTLFVLSGCCMLLLLVFFYGRHYATGFTLTGIALAGFALFMISDLFSPVYRHQYYTVQWLFPLVLCAAVYRPAQKKIYWLLAAGLVLNVLNIPFLPMEHSLGEYIMLAAIIVLSLRRETETIQ